MRLTDYLPHGPAMSTPPSERVRDVLTARHRKANALFSRTGFALIICIFASMALALPAFGHNIPQVLKSEGGKCQTEGTENEETIIKDACDTHTLNSEWQKFVNCKTGVRTAGCEVEQQEGFDLHWHMHKKKDGTEDGIGGWDKCVADAYDKDEDDYVLVGGKCPDGTSTEVITPPPETNAAPRFTTPATKSVPENTTSVPTVTASDTDSDDDIERYDISGGADASKFSLDPSTGALTFRSAPNFEALRSNNYVVEVEATSGTGGREKTTKQTITVTVTDMQEKPDTPGVPTVLTASETSLDVSWTEPTNKGPPIHDYDYRYRMSSPQGSWTEVTTTPIGVPSTTVGNLAPNTQYDVQVRANSPEGTSDWSTEGTGRTEATDPNNAAPRFLRPAKSIPENSVLVSDKVEAEDGDSQDSVTGYEIVGGADRERFEEIIVSSTEPLTAELRFKTAPDYENKQDANEDNVYEVIVRGTSGMGDRIKRTTQTIRVTVTNVQEPGDPVNPPVITDTTPGGTGGTPSGIPLSPLPGNVTMSFTAERYEASEDDEAMAFVVELSTESSQEAVVEYATATGTARASEDYEATSGTLTFPAGTTRRTIRVPIIDDDLDEPAEVFTIRLSNSNATITTGTATGVIADNDLPVVIVTTNQTAVEEGETVAFTLTRIGDLSVPLAVRVSITERGEFLADGVPTRAAFAINEVETTLQVATVDDEVDEENGGVKATITEGATHRVGDATTAAVLVTDNDGPEGTVTRTDLELGEVDVTVSFTRTRYEASEDDEALVFAVTLSTLSTQMVVVKYATVSGTARVGKDYGAATGTLTFPALTTRQTIRVPIIDDNVVEEEETFTVRLRNSNATIGVGEATGVIADNDLQVVSVTTTQTVVEEGGTVEFTLTRIGDLTAPLTVPVRVTERGAFIADEDAVPTEATFAANVTTTTLQVATVDDEVEEENGAVTVTITSGATHQVGDAAAATVLVTDNDETDGVETQTDIEEVEDDVTVSFAATRYEASEGDRVLDFAVRLSTATLQEVTVQYATVTGTATAGMDYAARTGILTFPAATTERTIRVPIIDDNVVEEEETFTVSLLRAFNAKIEVGKATGVITDNDLRVVVSIAANQTAVTEGGTAAFTLTRVGELTAPLTVSVQVTERGVFLTDEVPTAATFAANAATATLLVTTDDDGHVEANGSVTATITSGAYQIGAAASATVVVIDNDVRGVAVTPTALTIREGSSSSYMVGLDTEPTADVTVAVQVPEGAEISVTPTALTFTTANWNAKQLVVVTAAQDDDTVADDPLTIRHAVSGGDYGAVTAASVAVTIFEDDPAIRIADAAAVEGAGEMAFSVRLSVPSIQTVTVDWTTADGTAIAGQDYEAATGTLTFSALATTQTIRVPIIDDNLDEAAETFTVALRNSNVAIADGEATGVIADNDLPVVNVAADAAAVEEGETVAFTLTRIGDLTVPLRVPVRVTERGSFLADGVPTAATFAANAATTTLLVATDDDERDEADGAVTATITSGPTLRVGDAASATVPVIDNDVTDVPDVPVTPGVTVTPTVLRVLEGNTASYTVVLDSEPTADVTVAVQVPEDAEVAVDATELTFTTEDWNQAQTVTVTAAQDDDAVDDDPVTITHEVRGGNYDTVTAASVAVTILEDDMSALSVANAMASEGDGEMAFSVRLNLASSQTVTVEYVTAGGTATAGRDYETTTGTLTFSALETEQTIRVPIIDDDIDEAVETLTVMLINASNATIKDGKATGIITDDDERGVTVTPTALTIREGGNASYTVVLDTEPTADVTVEIQVPEDAEVAVDVTKLMFTAEDWNQSQTVTVTAAQDADAVADDPVTLTHVVSGGDYRSVTVASVAVTILEDDAPTLLITDAEASEGDGEMAFAVRLSVPSSRTVTVEYATADGTALAGTDYEETTGTLTFSAETTAQTIRVPIIDDDLDEVAEAFTVALVNASNATVEDGEAIGEIADNDLPVVSVTTDLTGVEEGGTVAFTLTRIGDLTGTLTVPVDVTERGSFLADEIPTEATFAADAATTVLLVTTDDDERDEADGAVTATITSGTTHRVGESASVTVSVTDNGESASATVPVIDNDERGVTVTPTALTVDEGGSGSYTVVLDTEPTADVTVEIQVPDNADIAVDKTELTFTADNWNTSQTVAVTAAQDADAVTDDPVTITHIVSGGDYEDVTAAGVEVTITEDDTAGVTISTDVLEVSEGSSQSYTVVLDTEPAADVTVEIQMPEDAEIAVSPLALTFTAANWNTPQTVAVTADQDDDAIDDNPVTLTHIVSGGDYEGVTAADVEVTIIEDDTTGVTISITALEVAEGDTGHYTIVLDTEPTADVTVEIQMPEDAEIAVSPLTLTFTADNWNTPQTVTVTAAQDDDAVADDPLTLTHAVSGGDYEGVTTAGVEVTIIEDDTTRVTISITALEVAEGDTGHYTIVLDTEPTADVTVEIQVPEDTDIAVSPLMLTFTADTWNTPQTVTVIATQDDDAVAADPVIITHAVSGGDYQDVTAAEVEVTIIEDDTTGVTISITALEISEGDTGRYTLVLDTEPTADVTVAIQVPENAEIAVDKTALTFTADNWNTPQTITVTAAQDDDAVTDDPVTITHAVSGGDYEDVAAVGVEVTITEDDTAGVTISTATLEVPEGSSQSYTIVLDTEPAADVTVEIQMPEDAEIAVSPLALTFTAANWNTPQTVAVTADQDDDAIDDSPVTLTHIVSGGDYEGVTTADVEVTIIEDDTTGVTISITALEVAEGDTGRYTIVLDTEPTADVTVEIQVPEDTDIAVSPLMLTFTADTWNTPQTVTVIATQDDDAVADDPVIITHAVSGGDYQDVTAAEVEVTIIEDDTTGVTISITALEISEGDTGRYTLVLDTEPTADVTVAIQVPENAEIAVDKTALTFTADNWNTPQTITVTAAQDDDAVTDDPVTITHAVSGGDYEDVAAAGVEVTITEDDTAGVTISTATLEVPEGSSQSYTIVLDTEPAADVTVERQVPENAKIAVSPLTLTFTAANWNTPQTVTVAAAQDDDAVTDDPVTITHAVSGGDYEDVAAAGVEVTITEDDTAGVTISTDALEVPEGSSQSYTVVLDTEPAADVTVEIKVPENAEIAVGKTALTFTADNWNTPQTVAVTAAQDGDAVTDDPVTITHIVSGGDYEDVTAAGVEVTITEDDTAGVTISTDALEVPEGSSQSYTVVLDTEPAADVMVVVAVPEDAEVAVSLLTLTFTADNWNTPQTVAVTAAHDDDAIDDDPVTLTHAVSGGDYEGVTAADVEVSIIEDDTPGVTVSETALTIPEGDSQSYMVVLDTEPAADAMVVVAAPEDAEVAVDETTLTFTAANWNTPQTVAVTAAHDDDAIADDPVTLTHTVSGGDYEGVSAFEVTVTITEDDTPALTIADANATEGDGQITFTVRLNVASSLAVTVDWATADGTATQGADYAETTGTLTFDALETEQTITVPLLDDALDENDETFTVALTNAANATLDDAEATGTIADNDDTPALTITDAEAAEGDGQITFTVTLGAASSLEVTVDWTTADGTATADADYVAADGRLTFAPGQTEATIAVAVFNDALDEGDETLTIALSDPTNATIADGTATGTIADDDPSVEKAWLARFGRTTASQVMDAVSDRLTGRSGGDAHLTVGGQRVTLASGRGSANAVDRTIPAKNASSADVLSQHPFYHLTRSSFADIISRSSFQVSSAKPSEEQGARWTAWGRGATTRFRSEEVDLSLTGGAATGLLGGDWQQGRMLAGLAVAHSVGTGEFDVHTAEQAFRKGELGTYLTSVHPYLRVAATERLSAWGLFGYGRGQMERMGDRPDTDIGMLMGGLGARGALLSPTELSAFDVALKSDAFLVRMDTDAATQPALETMTSRLRLQLEGGRPVELESGRMSPSLEVGVRHDGGDAETGLGLEVGGSLGYTHAQRGLALQATARRLLVHQANGYEEWGVGGSLSLDPGALGRGPSLRMQSSWGATSGMDRLWSQRSAADLARSTQAAGAGLFDAELGYGLDALGGLLTPYAHVASSGQGPRTYGLGGRLQVERSLRVDLVGERRERTAARAGHELKLRSTLYW